MTGGTFLLGDDQGQPLGVVDVVAINARGARLAFACAVASNAPRQLDQLITELVAEVGPRETGYVVAAALGTVVQDILEPLVQVVQATGHDVRGQLAADAARLST